MLSPPFFCRSDRGWCHRTTDYLLVLASLEKCRRVSVCKRSRSYLFAESKPSALQKKWLKISYIKRSIDYIKRFNRLWKPRFNEHNWTKDFVFFYSRGLVIAGFFTNEQRLRINFFFAGILFLRGSWFRGHTVLSTTVFPKFFKCISTLVHKGLNIHVLRTVGIAGQTFLISCSLCTGRLKANIIFFMTLLKLFFRLIFSKVIVMYYFRSWIWFCS